MPLPGPSEPLDQSSRSTTRKLGSALARYARPLIWVTVAIAAALGSATRFLGTLERSVGGVLPKAGQTLEEGAPKSRAFPFGAFRPAFRNPPNDSTPPSPELPPPATATPVPPVETGAAPSSLSQMGFRSVWAKTYGDWVTAQMELNDAKGLMCIAETYKPDVILGLAAVKGLPPGVITAWDMHVAEATVGNTVSIAVRGHEYQLIVAGVGELAGMKMAAGPLPPAGDRLLEDIRQGSTASLRMNGLSASVSLKGSSAALAAYNDCIEQAKATDWQAARP